jgi:site-specific DNA-methyltransferase (adenine-specific)
MGSGTTGISSKLLNRKFIGYEMETEYYQIAKARIKHWTSQNEQTNLFDILEE